jgi:hypothetical protein
MERLVGLYQAGRSDGESAVAFFRRVELPVVKSTLAGLDKIDPSTAHEEDFIDLAEDHAFRPEVQDGECSA